MDQLGIFRCAARTELKEKVPDVSDETLRYLNYAIKQAYNLGVTHATVAAESLSSKFFAPEDVAYEIRKLVER
jgi:hypothetical protein